MTNKSSIESNKTVAGCINCVCSNLSQNVMARRLLGLCPLLATTDSLLKALTMALMLIAVGLLSASVGSVLRATIYWRFKPIYFAVLASVSTLVVVNAVGGFFPVLINALGIYALLLAANCQIIAQLQDLAEHAPLNRVAARVLHDGMWVLVFMVLIASVREFGAYGTLLHDLSLALNASAQAEPLGWLPILRQPAGALIILALILGILNKVQVSRTSHNSPSSAEVVSANSTTTKLHRG